MLDAPRWALNRLRWLGRGLDTVTSAALKDEHFQQVRKVRWCRVQSPNAAIVPRSRKDDEEWNTQLELELAHPTLSLEQRDMIAGEYFADAKSLRLKVRQCLAAYIIQDLRLSTDERRHAPPEYQLMVNNTATLPPLFNKPGAKAADLAVEGVP